MSRCPECNKEQHFTCTNPDCVCQNIPEGALPQVWDESGNALSCPYCGFLESADFWAELEMEEVWGNEQEETQETS